MWKEVGIQLGVDEKADKKDCEYWKEAADVGRLGEVLGDLFEDV